MDKASGLTASDVLDRRRGAAASAWHGVGGRHNCPRKSGTSAPSPCWQKESLTAAGAPLGAPRRSFSQAKEPEMKLTATQVKTIENKTGFKPLPDDAASQSGLADAFGDQTFYVDPNGVYVFESVEPPSGEGEAIMAIQIAEVERPAAAGNGASEGNGSDEGNSGEVTVRPIQPRTTSLTVDLAA
jgi:hypothetical protein